MEPEKDLLHVVKINDLVRELRKSLELFELGEEEDALEKIASVSAGIEDLSEKELAGNEEVEEKLTRALEDLKWVEEESG